MLNHQSIPIPKYIFYLRKINAANEFIYYKALDVLQGVYATESITLRETRSRGNKDKPAIPASKLKGQSKDTTRSSINGESFESSLGHYTLQRAVDEY